MPVYVKNCLTSNVITRSSDRPDGVEDVWLSIQVRKLPSIIVGSVYRHPKAPQETFNYVNKILRKMCLKNKSLYMSGDINDDLLKRGNKLSTIINMNKLHQIVDKPTRVTLQSATLLDVIVTNKRDTVIYKDIIPKVIADHGLISATIDISKPKRAATMKTLRHMGAYSSDALCNAVSSQVSELDNINRTDDVDSQITIPTSVLTLP